MWVRKSPKEIAKERNTPWRRLSSLMLAGFFGFGLGIAVISGGHQRLEPEHHPLVAVVAPRRLGGHQAAWRRRPLQGTGEARALDPIGRCCADPRQADFLSKGIIHVAGINMLLARSEMRRSANPCGNAMTLAHGKGLPVHRLPLIGAARVGGFNQERTRAMHGG